MLNKDRMPTHVAVIMDGNGRWAKERGVPRLAGHNAGMKAMKKIVDHSDKLGIKHLTVYAFSTENWKRSLEEVSGIFKLLVSWVASDLKGLIDNNVKVKILGDYTAPSDLPFHNRLQYFRIFLKPPVHPLPFRDIPPQV